MALTTSKQAVHLKDLTITFRKSVKAADPFYSKVCMTVPSDGADEKYGWLGAYPGVREWLGERQFNEMRAATYEIVNKHWESSLLIPRNDLKDGRTLQYTATMQNLAAEATHHPDELFFSVLQAGESSTCYDGQFFFDTDHVFGDSGTQSNDVTSTVSSTTAVTAAEMKTAIRAAVNKLLSFKRDNGKYVNRPTSGRLSDLMLLVPLALKDATIDALESTVLSNSSNVVIDRPMVEASPLLTSNVKFYLFRTGTPIRPFIFQEREKLHWQMKYNGNTDIEFKDAKFMTEQRHNVGYGDWTGAVLTTLTT